MALDNDTIQYLDTLDRRDLADYFQTHRTDGLILLDVEAAGEKFNRLTEEERSRMMDMGCALNVLRDSLIHGMNAYGMEVTGHEALNFLVFLLIFSRMEVERTNSEDNMVAVGFSMLAAIVDAFEGAQDVEV